MSVLDILTEDLLDELPDDPHAAFGLIVRRADAYLKDQLSKVEDNEQSSWYGYETAQHTVLNTIIAVARRYEIEPFASMVVPTRKDYSSDQFVEFKVELDHYTAQLVLDNSIRTRRDSIKVPPKIKDRLRSHIHGMKQLIDNADVSEARRETLHNKIREFEKLLEKDRVPIFAVARIVLEILSISANVVAIADSPTLAKLTANIMQAMAEAKATDDETRQLPPGQPPQLALPPRPVEVPRPSAKESFRADLDDEIPF